MLLLSNYGERPIHYNFGANLRSIIFEQGNNLPQKVIDAIKRAVNNWMPFVNIDNIQVSDISTDPTLRNNEIKVKINFSVGQVEGVLEQNISA